LGKEGGHSRRRIVHAKDYTGYAIEKTLIKKVKDGGMNLNSIYPK
jgi:aspartate oxidase